MDDKLKQLYADYIADERTLGIITIEKRPNMESNTDYFDAVLLAIVTDDQRLWQLKHFTIEKYKVAMHIVSTHQINDWLLNSSNRRIVDWLMNGTIVFDKNEYIHMFRKQMLQFPIEERKIRIGVEFAKLIRCLKESKSLYYAGHYLDAYNLVVQALHHLAKLSIIENGFHPEVTVWQQVKQMNPQVYKLYSELVTGSEPIEKKLELLLIANEFGLISKTKLGSTHIIELMKRKNKPWTIEELKGQLGMEEYSLDLTVLLQFLVEKGYVKEVKVKTKGKDISQRLYEVNKKGI